MQTPAFWGGDMSLRVTVVMSVTGYKSVDVPIDIANIQV